MNIGIVTTWFERGAAIVSRQYMDILKLKHNVFIYARSGETYARGNPVWDLPNVYWSKEINSPFTVTVIDKYEFINWLNINNIQIVLFNEQHWWEPLIWCQELQIKTIAYIDYYTEETVDLFGIYDILICNTRKHFEAFKWHPGAQYIPWGTETSTFIPYSLNQINVNRITFFHSCGMNPKRKGTDLLLQAIQKIERSNFKVILHTQIKLEEVFPDLRELISKLTSDNKLEIINKTINAPGLYHLGDIYVYPSRLEGIGLTIAEAMSCGLPVIVPNCGPMNEFIDQHACRTVQIDKFYSRYDGYYWPQNEVDIQSLAENMQSYLLFNAEEIKEMKVHCRNFALENLNWSKNSGQLLGIIQDLSNLKLPDKDKYLSKILNFENKGLRRYNKYYLKFPWIFDFIRSLK